MTEELNQTFSELFEKGTNKYLRENKKIRILINTTTESLNFKNIYSIYQKAFPTLVNGNKKLFQSRPMLDWWGKLEKLQHML